MALNITDADAYIGTNCIVIEDWTSADAASKQRMLNVAGRTLTQKYPTYSIPDAAAYEFANVLATAFNDTNKLGRQGVTSFSIDRVGSFSFKNDLVTGPDADLSALIPQAALDIIGAENGVTISKRAPKWTVL